ncbi:MAG: methyltransferase domain-containing protein [Thermoplasmata archaeon]
MPTREIAAQFDQISLVYDETRDPLDGATIEGLADALRRAGAESILEVGVGTGRVAKPLAERDVAVTGLDASIGMLEKARKKGLLGLVRGSGYHLPFRDAAFDATLFVHVLHVLEDPTRAVAAAARVSRLGTFALVHPRGDDAPAGRRREDEPRHLVREILAEQGYPMPPRASPWSKERDFLALHPPDSLHVVSEKDVTESLRDRIDRLEKRGHRNLLTIPPEKLRYAIGVARERVGDRTVTYHRVEALATWGTGRAAADSAPAPA